VGLVDESEREREVRVALRGVGRDRDRIVLLAVPPELELPGREAPDVDVELVEARVVAIMSELDLELHLVGFDRQMADRDSFTTSEA
jgi:hypothetical protein